MDTLDRDVGTTLDVGPRAGAWQVSPLFQAYLPCVFLVAVLLVFGFFLASRYAPAICAPDANGYWAQGTLLAETGKTWFVPASNVQYVGMHWLVTEKGKYFSRYPPGLAVLIALVDRLVGYRATVMINPVLSLLAIAGFFLLLRALLSAWWGLAGALLLATTPTFCQHALQNDSHMAITTLLIWGVWLLLRWHRDGRVFDLFLAGLVFGVIPTVRYPEVLFGLGVGAFLLLHCLHQSRHWRHVPMGVVGALIPLAALLLRNHLSFGAFWRTAYNLTHEQTGFGWSYFQAHAVSYVRALNGEGVGLFFGLGIAGIILLWWRREERPIGAFLVFAIVPLTLLYMAYYWVPGRPGGQDAALRFVLPTFPCYYAAGLYALAATTRLLPCGAAPVAGVLLVVLQMIWGGSSSLADTRRGTYQREALALLTDHIERVVADGSVIMADTSVQQHLDFVRRWRCADLSLLTRGGGGRPGPRMQQSGADEPSPMQQEKLRLERDKYAGMSSFGRERAVAYDLAAWAAGRAVYIVSTEEQLQRLSPFYFGSAYVRIVARIPMPEAPREDLPGRMGPGFPGGGFGGEGPPAPNGPDEMGPSSGGGPPPGLSPMDMPRQSDVRSAAPGGRRSARLGGAPGARGPFPGGPPDRRRGRGMRGLSPDVRELVVAEWTWVPNESP